jgi:hypothetical protein
MGLLQVVMYRGRVAGTDWKDENNAFLQHLAQLDRACTGIDAAARKSRAIELASASTPPVDFPGAPVGAAPISPPNR